MTMVEENGDAAMTPAALKAWAKAGAEDALPGRGVDRTRALPDGEHEGTAKHPFKAVDREAYRAQVRGRRVAELTHKAPVGKIRLDALVGIQRTVNRERLAQHLRDPALIPEGTRGAGHGGRIDLPVVVKVGGVYYLHDGTHRASAAYLRGEKTLRVRLVDLDAEG